MFHSRLVENIMSFNYRDKKHDVPAVRDRETGFSMVELMIVCVIMVLIAGMAVPNIYLRIGIISLIQQGIRLPVCCSRRRMQAVKTNLPTYANFSNGTSVNTAFVTNDPANTTVCGRTILKSRYLRQFHFGLRRLIMRNWMPI